MRESGEAALELAPAAVHAIDHKGAAREPSLMVAEAGVVGRADEGRDGVGEGSCRATRAM